LKEVKIALFGCGNIGTGVYKLIRNNCIKIMDAEGVSIVIKKILVRDLSKKRYADIDESLFTNKIEDILLDKEIDIVAEFIGGESPAKEYILKALNHKKTVVTANKEVIAKHFEALQEAARQNEVGLYYEASVGGGMPIIRAIHQSLQANRIQSVMGIINGTTNYILSKMAEEGREFEDVLSEAKELGYAEPDPTADIEGYDARYKLSILATLCFNKRVQINNILCEGITKITSVDIQYARELGYGVKLLAIAKDTQNSIEVRVHPTFIPINHPLYAVRDAFNAVYIKGDSVGELMFYGRGAGDMPTGSAIVSDIITASTNKHHYVKLVATPDEEIFEDNWLTEYYIRLSVFDKPGVLSKIAGIFAKYNVSITSVLQKARGDVTAPLIFVTHEAHEKAVLSAINEIKKCEYVNSVENLIRVEK